MNSTPRSKSIAIIGASRDRAKFGNKAVRGYGGIGWTVYPINPHATEIEGLRSYKSVLDVPLPLDRVSVYLQPELVLEILDDIACAGPQDVYFNPGADSPAVMRKAAELGLNAIQDCALVAEGIRPALIPSS